MTIYEVGSTVCEAQPFVHVLDSKHKGLRCDNCYQLSHNLKKCSKCKIMYYCSKKCQAEDWKAAHKFKECELFCKDDACKEICLASSDVSPHLLIRTFLKVKLDPDAGRVVKLYDGRERAFTNLMSHADEFKRNFLYMVHLRHVRSVLQLTGLDINLEELVVMKSRLNTNSFAIHDFYPLHEELGSGIYLKTSIFDHSCERNCVHIFDGTRMIVRASRTFDSAFEPPTVTYLNISRPREERRAKLKSIYNFDCNCKRCLSDDDFGFDLEEFSEKLKRKCQLTPKQMIDVLSATLDLEFKSWNGFSLNTVAALFYSVQIAKSNNLPERKQLEQRFKEAAVVVYGQEGYIALTKRNDEIVEAQRIEKQMRKVTSR